MSHILQIDKLEDDSALFALALGPATRTSITLCGGSSRGFADISQLFGVWQALRLPVSLVVPAGVERFLPSGITQASMDGDIRKQRELTAWQLIDSAGLVVVGPNMQLTSTEQVMYARLLPNVTVPVILTDEALSLWSIDSGIQENTHITWLASTDLVEKMQFAQGQKIIKARAIFGVAEFLRSLQLPHDFVMLYDAVNLYSYIPASDMLIHTPLQGSQKQTRNLVLALLPVTVFARSRGVALQERLRVLHYLFSIISENTIGDSDVWSAQIKRALS